MNVKAVVILVVCVGLVLLATEYWARKGGMKAVLARKLLHFTGVGALAIAPFFFHSFYLLGGVALFFAIVLFLAVHYGWIKMDLYGRKSLGIALFTPAFLVLWWTWGRTNPMVVVQSLLILALADPLAAIAGQFFPLGAYRFTGDNKTLAGSTAFFIVCFAVLAVLYFSGPFLFPGLQPDATQPLPFFILLGLWGMIAFLLALAEGASSGGWDNATVPLLAGWLLAVLPAKHPDQLVWLLPVFIILLLSGYVACRKHWLDAGGAVWAIFTGIIIWIGGGLPSLGLMGAFFITGSLTSKIPLAGWAPTDAKHGKPRDYAQVLCNGGVAAACLACYAVFPWPSLLTLFVISVAISTADTWSSDIGRRLGKKVVDIRNFQPLPAGISGGISWQGTLAGLAGAFFIAFLGRIIGFEYNIWWVGLAGFSGMLTDSLLGSWLQVRYLLGEKNAGGKLVEFLPGGQTGIREKGFLWMNNDRVNLLSNLLIIVLCAIWLFFMR